jgi:hypothetical protein
MAPSGAKATGSGRARGVSAEAREDPPFLAGLAVIAHEAIGREDGMGMAGGRLVVQFREATRATYASIFLLSAFVIVESFTVAETFPRWSVVKFPQQ